LNREYTYLIILAQSPKMTVRKPSPTPPGPPKIVNNILNALIGALLQSPLHGVLSNSALVLEFQGRKSHKVYKFPIGYYELNGDSLLLIPLHHWWVNLQGGVPVRVWLKGHKYAATAQAYYGDKSTVAELERLIRESANLKRVFKLVNKEGQLDTARIHEVAGALSLVRINWDG
jgi:hypothetical protein